MRSAFTTGRPMVRLGTKWLSITSTCSQSAPRTAAASSASRAKSAESRLGAIIGGTLATLPASRSGLSGGAGPRRNIASVPCRCGQSCTAGPGPRSGTPGEARRAGVEQLGGAVGQDVRQHVAGLGQVRGAGDVRDDAARADGGQRGAQQPRAAGRPARRRPPAGGASGPRAGGAARPARCTARRASTRSKRSRAARPGIAPSARPRTGRPPARRRRRAAHQLGPVRGDLDGGRRRAPRPGRRARRAARPCRRGRRTGRASAASAPSSGAASSASAHSWLPSSWTPARPSRTTAQRARVAAAGSRTAYGDHGPGSPPARATSSSRSTGPGGRPGASAGGRRRPRSAASVSASVAAERVPRRRATIQRGCACRIARWPTGSASAAGATRPTQAARSCAGDPAQHRVDEPGRPAPTRRDQVDGRPTPRRAAGPGCAAAGRRRGAARRAPAASSRPAGGRRRRPGPRRAARRRAACRTPSSVANAASRPVRPRSRSSAGQHQVGVGVPLGDGAQQVVRGPAGGVGVRPRCRRPGPGRRSARRAGRRAATSPLGPRRPPSAAAATRAPRAQSAAGIGRLPGGCTSPSPTGVGRRCRPARRRCSTAQLARAPAPAASGDRRHRAELQPLAARTSSRRPGAGVQARTSRSTAKRRRAPSRTRASSTVTLRRERDPVGRLRHGRERAVRDPVHGRDEQAGAGHRRAAPAGRRRCRGAGSSRSDAEHRAGVQPLLEQERAWRR